MKGVLMMNFGKKMAVGVASAALVASLAGVPAAVANKSIPLPGGAKLERVDGVDRMLTSFNAAKLRMQDKQSNGVAVKTAYLVNQDSVVDAATAGMVKDGVVLLVPSDAKGQQLLGAMMSKDDDLKKIKKLVAIGGEAVMPKEAVANVAKMNRNINSKSDRLGGKNRYETNVAIAKKVYKDGGSGPILLTRGDNPVDGITAGSYEAAATLLVNPAGDVDKSTKSYMDSLKGKNQDVLVLGGESVLPEDQVKKLFDGVKQLDPWSYKDEVTKLKNNLRKAAANFIGQSAWQKGTDNVAGYFGRAAENSNNGACIDDMKLSGDQSLINVSDGIPATEKCFIGYDRSLGLVKANAAKILKQVSAKQDALDNQVKAVKAANVTAQAEGKTVKGYPANAGNLAAYSGYAALSGAFKAMYGVAPEAPEATIDSEGVVTVNNPGSWKFSADGAFDGVNEDAVASVIADYKDAAGDSKVIKLNASTTVKLGDLPTTTLGATDTIAKADGATLEVNFGAVAEVTKKALADLKAGHAEAKKALDDAIIAWKASPFAKVVERKGSGSPRIVGKDRYETSALLSYYLRGASNSRNFEGWTENNGWGFGGWKHVYFASGEDAHLIDSVVAGQLRYGPILLVKSDGDLPESVAKEIKNMGTAKKVQGGWVIGGKKAVSDKVAKAGAAKFSEGGKFVTDDKQTNTRSDINLHSVAGHTNPEKATEGEVATFKYLLKDRVGAVITKLTGADVEIKTDPAGVDSKSSFDVALGNDGELSVATKTTTGAGTYKVTVKDKKGRVSNRLCKWWLS
ncbi:cell wall-binding repeat-containing protein [Mobiluncus mulieris]|nr:cell wall-binding repeat-containing protein [Mobiluncus mulieris]